MKIVRNASLVLLLISVFALFFALPVAPSVAFAQVPTKTPPLPPGQTQEVPTLIAPALATAVATQNTLPTPLPTTVVEEAVEEGSAAQLSLGRPLLGMTLLEFADAPAYFYESTLGGGDLFINLGDPCASGYTSAPATLGLVTIDATGPVQIGFQALNAGSASTAIILWDVMAAQWSCSQAMAADNFLEFSGLNAGIYFIWVLTDSPQAVSGSVFISEPL